ncbi:MAG: hypothetical protein K0R76_545 [Alphaproteobacteria bacterium]|nr:hypothetical protein [Alphaproteobacteria bacterium]
MTIVSISMLFPYITLALLIAGLLVVRSRILLAALLAAQIMVAFIQGIIDPAGICAVAAFWGICTLHWQNLSSKEWINCLRVLFIAGAAIAFASHMVPGFHNLRVYSGILISPTAMPFTMYLNFDKVIAAVVLVIASGVFLKQTTPFGVKSLRDTVVVSAFCISLLIPLAILSGYVNFDPKFPESFWLWAFNNLYFVCFAEEVIFRGIIQTHLMKIANRCNVPSFVPIFVSALLFAVALPGHRQGGTTFIAFVTLSGLFYGYAYHRTKRLESAILVHFIVNVCHFLLFSYPAAAVIVK